MAKARLETELTGNAEPFIRSVEQAEKRAQSFSARITSLFRRDPTQRAERALSGFITDLSSGNVLGAIEGVSSRLSGLGLAAGVGLGVVVGLAIKAKEQFDAVDKSVLKLNEDLSKPLAITSALGPEGIGKEIESLNKNLDDLVEKRKGIFQRLREAAQKGQPGQFDVGPAGEVIPVDVDRVPAAAKAQERAEQRLRELKNAQADAELRVVDAKRLGLQVSEQDGALAKLSLETEKARAKVILDSAPNRIGRDQVTFFKRLAGVDASDRLGRDAIEDQAKLRERNIEHEKTLLGLQSQGFTADQQKVAILRENLSNAQNELALQTNITKEKRAQLELEVAKARGALDSEEQRALNPARERAKLSFEELLKGKFTPTLNIGGAPTAFQDQLSAKRAQEFEQRGEQAKGRGDIDEALRFFLKADEEKSQIGRLRDSDKSPYFQLKNALSITEEILSRIDKNTAQPSRPVNR